MSSGTEAGAVLRVLVVEDDVVSRLVLLRTIREGGFEVEAVNDAEAAQAILAGPTPPTLVVTDWMMPGMTGVELVRWIRAQASLSSTYAIVVTARDTLEDILECFEAGADDFLTKPVRKPEILARLRAGARIVGLQGNLRGKVQDLESALAEVRQLRGLIPICMHCHRIRSEGEHWEKLEQYIEANSAASFSHSLCGDCLERLYPEDGGENPAGAAA